MAPVKPEIGRDKMDVWYIPKTMFKHMPIAAPPEIPSVYGSTNGLRKSPCNITPARDKEPPTAKPRIIRGRRISKMMLYSVEPLPSRIVRKIFFKGIPEEPMHKEKMLTTKRIPVKINICIDQRNNFLLIYFFGYKISTISLSISTKLPGVGLHNL